MIKADELLAAKRAMRQLSHSAQDKLLEQYLEDGIACDKARITALEIERDELLDLLRQVRSDLPSRRDWLDPTLEKRIDTALSNPKKS